MTDRNAMNFPATVTAALLGVLLIGISIPLLMVVGGPSEGRTTYSVTWFESAAGARTEAQGARGATTTVTLDYADILASNLTLSIECTDTRGAGNVAPAATVTWSFTYLNETVNGDACGIDMRYELGGHPDIEEITADSVADAYASFWNRPGFMNSSGQAVLTFSWNRAQTTGPVPVPPQGTNFVATLAVGVMAWDANVAAATEEASR